MRTPSPAPSPPAVAPRALVVAVAVAAAVAAAGGGGGPRLARGAPPAAGASPAASAPPTAPSSAGGPAAATTPASGPAAATTPASGPAAPATPASGPAAPTAPAAVEAARCAASSRLPVPADPAAPGPWPVGARTIAAAGLRVEVWYPARPGSERGAAPVAYDLAEVMSPAGAERLVRSGAALTVPCRCHRDLPLDDRHGPYPVVVYFHGRSLCRFASASLTAHWASRGFVVLAADFPGAGLADVMAGQPFRHPARDAGRLLDAVARPAGDLAFLDGRIDAGRLGLAGHSLGGDVVSRLGAARGSVLITMAELGVAANRRCASTLVVGGHRDRFQPWRMQRGGYRTSPAPKRLVGIRDADHMDFSDLCLAPPGPGASRGLLGAALERGVEMTGFAAKLARSGCGRSSLAPGRAATILRHLTTAVLEERLACSTEATAALERLAATFAEVQEHEADLRCPRPPADRPTGRPADRPTP